MGETVLERTFRFKLKPSAAQHARLRALAQSCVAWAMQEHGRINPEKAEREAHDIASLAAHLLVSRIYNDDTELRTLKEENERLRELAYGSLITRPPSLTMPI